MNRVFAWVGIIFGALFVVINAAELPGAWTWIARAVGAALVVTAIEFGVRRTAPRHVAGANSGARVYWIAAGAEILAIPAGSIVIDHVLDRPELTVTWVVFVVGIHFLSAVNFGFPRWTTLGVVMVTLAVGGVLGALAADEAWAPAAAVLAGLAMLAFVTFADRYPIRAPE